MVIATLKKNYKRPTVEDVFNAVLEARQEALKEDLIPGASQRPLITVTRDMAEMLGYFREPIIVSKRHEMPHISATKAFAPLIEEALRFSYGLLECPFETDEYAGVRLSPGLRIALKKNVYTKLMSKKDSLGFSTDQSVYNAALYTGCLARFPSFEEFDDVIISVPKSRFNEGIFFYHFYDERKFKSVDLRVHNQEMATVIEDSEITSHLVKVRSLGEEFMLPKNYLYHVEDIEN